MDGCKRGSDGVSGRREVLRPSLGMTDQPTVMLHRDDARRREIRRVSSAIIPATRRYNDVLLLSSGTKATPPFSANVSSPAIDDEKQFLNRRSKVVQH